ncbi:MAG: molecular chaperone TorD family protein [Siculibacillus sp.]
MPRHSGTTLTEEIRRDIATDLRFIAALHAGEPSADFLEALSAERVEDLFHFPPRGDVGLDACDFFERALRATGREKAEMDELAADFAAIYLTHAHRVSPSESPWIDPEGLVSQDPMFEVRDWYRHYGLQVANWRMRPDDHLVSQLVFLAHLFELEDRPHAAADAARFLDRHLLRWIGAFATGVAERCYTPYWASVARLTEIWLVGLRDFLVEATGVEREQMEPLECEKQRRREAMIQHESCAAPTPVGNEESGW